jgi:hypothetical protein
MLTRQAAETQVVNITFVPSRNERQLFRLTPMVPETTEPEPILFREEVRLPQGNRELVSFRAHIDRRQLEAEVTPGLDDLRHPRPCFLC